MDRHQENVAAISARVRDFYERKEGFRIYHGSTNSTRALNFQRDKVVDISHLNTVLAVDGPKRLAWVEPNVPMDRLLEATLKEGLIPKVVMEFPGITVGGGFAGPSGESSSFKHGFFENIVESIEVVLGNGRVVTTSKTELPDLLDASRGSFGTLGIATLLGVQLMEAKTFVHLVCHPIFDVPGAIEKIKIVIADDANDYVDGILFALDRGVVMAGHLTDKVASGVPVQTFSRAQDPWFYIHIERLFNQKKSDGKPFSIAIPLADYLFRYDRGAFWIGKYAYQYFLTPFNRITRWALDTFMHTRVMYHAMHASGQGDRYIVQDLAMPETTTEEFIHHVDKELRFYPLWLCPLREGPSISLNPRLPKFASDDGAGTRKMLLNVGVWGPGPTNHQAFVAVNRRLEQKARDLGGLKWMYARAYYTEEEFWQIYDRKKYEAVREKYNATLLPSVYDKIKAGNGPARENEWTWRLMASVWDIWPVSGLYGVYRAVLGLYAPFGKDYVLAK
jgi:Delta24-sterol reductase